MQQNATTKALPSLGECGAGIKQNRKGVIGVVTRRKTRFTTGISLPKKKGSFRSEDETRKMRVSCFQ